MADMDTQTTHTEPVVDEEAPLFSNMDLLLFSIIVGFFIYWFMSRKKPEPIPEFKKLDTPKHLHLEMKWRERRRFKREACTVKARKEKV